MPTDEREVYRFGDFTLVPRERSLSHRGAPVAITGKAFDMLVALVSDAGHLLTKDVLLQKVWPGLVVEEVNLTVNMSALRKALAVSGDRDWIETVPRQGYRFNAPVTLEQAPHTHLPNRPRRRMQGSHVAALVGVAALVLGVSAWVLPAVHDRIAADLGAGVRVAQPDPNDAPAQAAHTVNAEAYKEYLQGRFLWSQRSEPGLQRAISHFERAVELDPDFALAYAALADTHTTLGYLGHMPPVSTFPVARPYALKALKLDPSLAQAHAALAYIKFYFDWDWAGAAEEFQRALDLNPNDAITHQWRAVYLRAAGRPDEAQREVETAHRLDPLSLAINTDIGFHHYYAGRYEEAIAQLQAVLGMKPDFALAHLWLARSLLEMGKLEEAMQETSDAEKSEREWPVLMAARGFTSGVMGKSADARDMLREMHQLSSRRFVTAYGFALVHAGLGEKDEAFQWLEKAFEERSHWLVWLRLDPRWKALRADPRFDALVQRMKYPD
jgi:DNA-binding winged helix-turn-helix (wHTH) protein/Tfp pilus assembly protein PilF